MSEPTPYVELHAHSCYSLLDATPFPEELVNRAVELGQPAIALTDHDALYGIVPFYLRAREVGIKPILGAELTLEDDSHLTLLAETYEGYRNLCRLISAGRLTCAKGESRLAWQKLTEHKGGLICLTGCRRGPVARHLLVGDEGLATRCLELLLNIFPTGNLYVELQRNLQRGDMQLSRRLAALARTYRLPIVATGNVHYLRPEDAELQSVLVSVRERLPFPKLEDKKHDQLPAFRPNQEYYLRSSTEVCALYTDLPEAIRSTERIAERCNVTLPTGLQILPKVPTPNEVTADEYLRQLCEEALPRYYERNWAEAIALLEKELNIIARLGLANYFLVIWDIVCFCKREGILCHGRGSAANSLVARLLGITSVDPICQKLIIERFLSVEYGGTPDVDLDIDALERERVIQYVRQQWGIDMAVMACTYITYRSASALNDAGYALGFTKETLKDVSLALAEQHYRAQEAQPESQPDAARLNNEEEVEEPDIPISEAVARLQTVQGKLSSAEWSRLVDLAGRLRRRPRHLGQHNGGTIVAGEPIDSLIPIEPASMPDRRVVQFDKEWLEALGIVKIDLLGLRMLSVLSRTVQLVQRERGLTLDLDRLDCSDPRVYAFICSGKTIGIFQVESGAQVSIIPELQPRCFQDLVVEVSLIRPGPLQGNMVHPYLRRRNGKEPITYPHPLLQSALELTLGVIVFQEQVIAVARDFAGFTPGRGELLRRALGSKYSVEATESFHAEFVQGAVAKGVTEDIAEQVWDMIKGFAGYSFSQAHASAFAVLVYWSAWLRFYYPVEYFCALMQSSPLGTYPPHVLESEGRRSHIRFLPIDINSSQAQADVQNGCVRHGLDYVKGVGPNRAKHIIECRGDNPFTSIEDFIRRTNFGRRVAEPLVLAGAFDGFGERNQMRWELSRALNAVYHPLALPLEFPDEQKVVKPLSDHKKLALIFATTGVTAGAHLTEIHREAFKLAGCWPYEQLLKTRLGSKVKVGGLVADGIRRPESAEGTAFIRLDCPEGMIDVTIPENLFLKFHQALRSNFLIVEGVLRQQIPTVSLLLKNVQAV